MSEFLVTDSDIEEIVNEVINKALAVCLGNHEGAAEDWLSFLDLLHDDEDASVFGSNVEHEEKEKPSLDHKEEATVCVKSCFGRSIGIPVISISPEEFLYAASTCLCQYNLKTKLSMILCAFPNEVSCLARSSDLIAVGDSGDKDCTIVIFDLKTRQRKHCWLGKVPGGFKIIKFVRGGNFVLAATQGAKPELFIWNMTDPPRLKTLPQGEVVDIQAAEDSEEMILTFRKKVVIAMLGENGNFSTMEAKRPKSTHKVGIYRASAIVKSQIYTATSSGEIIVTSLTGNYCKTIEMGTCISTICFSGDCVLIGYKDGALKIYEHDLRLKETLLISPKPIIGIEMLQQSDHHPQFNFSTSSGLVGTHNYQQKTSYVEFPQAVVTSLDCHPSEKLMTVGYANGEVAIYDTKEEKLVKKKFVLSCSVTVVRYSNNGWDIAAGASSGEMKIFDRISLKSTAELPQAPASISHLIFHPRRNLLAYAHASHGIGLVKMTGRMRSHGKYRPHNKAITGMVFAGDSLFTISADRTLVQFDTQHTLRMVDRSIIEDFAVPTSIAYFEDHLLISNSDYRVRCFDISSKKVVRTIRSPGEEPITAMKVVKKKLIIATGSAVGWCPLPWKEWGTLRSAHPRIANFAANDCEIFTAGTNDYTVLTWSIQPFQAMHKTPLPIFQNERTKFLFQNGSIPKRQLFECLTLCGHFPSQFEMNNIERENEAETIGEEKFREILFNYGPPPYISKEQIHNAVLSVSDVARGVVHTDQLIGRLTSTGFVTENQLLRSLKRICTPGLIPNSLTIDELVKILRH